MDWSIHFLFVYLLFVVWGIGVVVKINQLERKLRTVQRVIALLFNASHGSPAEKRRAESLIKEGWKVYHDETPNQ